MACRSDANHNEFYLAGITSAGYNPTTNQLKNVLCGEPHSLTVFTKPSFYLEWINTTMYGAEDVHDIWPRPTCPYVTCANGRCVIALDGIPDCMYGEDEIKKF